MNKEKKVLFSTMILNFLIATIKLIGGLLFNFSTLLADSIQSYSDFITDIISSLSNKIGKKRSNKKHPFGYGRIENIFNLFIGIILILVSIFIIINSFIQKETIINSNVLFILTIALILKSIVILLLYKYSVRLNSNTLKLSLKESSLDLISTSIAIVISILLLFSSNYPLLKYSDMVGSIIISIIIFRLSIRIIIENTNYLLGISEDNKIINKNIKLNISKYKEIKDYNINLIKVGNYYNLFLTISINNIDINRLFIIEKELKKTIKKDNNSIKFITIEEEKYVK